jgi:hypothetical protein
VSFAARAVICALSLCGFGAPGLAAAVAAPDATLAQLADLYRRGHRDDALGEIGLWTGGRTRREVDAFLQARPFDAVLANAAALLQVSRALLPSEMSLDDRGANLDAATRLVLAAAEAKATPDGAALARRMFLLLGLAREDTLDVGAAHDIARAGLERFEGDAELLTVLGTTLEAGPSMRTYELPLDPKRRPSTGRPSYTVEGGGSRGEGRPFPASTLGEAEAAFRRAVAADPGLGEARLRLGRVRTLRGRLGEAIADLQQVAREDRSLRRRYLANLFAARAHEKRGDIESAARAYRAAVAIEPEGQSAWIGLGRALDLLERRDEAQKAFAAALGIARKGGDPWWSYIRGDLERLESLMAELQRALTP